MGNIDTKKIYRKVLKVLEKLPASVERRKTIIAETHSINKKKPILCEVKWSAEQQTEFDEYWEKVYGKKISNKWHRLYQAANNVFCITYIPEKIYTTKIEPLFNDAVYSKVLKDKSMVELLSKGICMVPETLLIKSGRIYYDGNRKPITESKAIEVLSQLQNFVIKPTVGSSSGQNILFIKECTEPSNIVEKMGDDFICQKRIIQHKDLAKLNESSINTIRITTYIIDGQIYHIPIALRIGRKGKNVDNIHAGGIVIGVEDDGTLLDTGYELGYGDKTIKYNKHPDNGVEFKGVKLGFIPQIIETAYRCHQNYPHVGIISWDFSEDNQGNIILIEANLTGQGVWFPQIIHGKSAFGDQAEKILTLVKKGNKI